MEIIRFKDLSKEELNKIIDYHFNHWVQYSPLMEKEQTIYKFTQLYTKEEMPFGLALYDNNNLIGFCVLKKDNLKKYPDITPWLSDVFILKEYRNKGYGRILIQNALKILKDIGYNKVYVWTDQAPEFYQHLGFKYEMQVEKNEEGYGELYSINI